MSIFKKGQRPSPCDVKNWFNTVLLPNVTLCQTLRNMHVHTRAHANTHSHRHIHKKIIYTCRYVSPCTHEIIHTSVYLCMCVRIREHERVCRHACMRTRVWCMCAYARVCVCVCECVLACPRTSVS